MILGCEVCGEMPVFVVFDVTVSSRVDAEHEIHTLCPGHYRRWLRWHNYRNWIAKMRAEAKVEEPR